MPSMRPANLAKVVLVVLLAGCRPSDQLIGDKGSPIILISIDTLRSDHLPAYGYSKIALFPVGDPFCAGCAAGAWWRGAQARV